MIATIVDTETADAEDLPPWPAAPTPGPPARIGRYLVVRELGRGRTGVVYEARAPGRRRPVAIKTSSAGRAATVEIEARFLFEACTLLRLAHPAIVRAYEIGRHDGGLFFVMDCIRGPTLAQRLRGDPPDLVESLRITAAVARGLHHAHQRGLIHRDIKPQNIVLTGAMWPRIIDFGIAMPVDEGTGLREGRILGTPGYMAPEQAPGGTQAVGPAADIYALGVVLQQLLASRAPFHEADTRGILSTVKQHDLPARPALASGIPGTVEQLCRRAMARDPAHRHESALELARDLERCLRQELGRQSAVAVRSAAAGTGGA
jgi:serine/threonine protein kinase